MTTLKRLISLFTHYTGFLRPDNHLIHRYNNLSLCYAPILDNRLRLRHITPLELRPRMRISQVRTSRRIIQILPINSTPHSIITPHQPGLEASTPQISAMNLTYTRSRSGGTLHQSQSYGSWILRHLRLRLLLHRAILPALLPQLIHKIHILMRRLIPLLLRLHLIMTHSLRHWIRVARHYTPRDSSPHNMIQCRSCSHKNERRYITPINQQNIPKNNNKKNRKVQNIIRE